MANIGIKGTTSPKNIASSDFQDFFVNSQYYNLKIMDNDPTWPKSVTISSGSYNVSYTINHGLGYIPIYDLYFKDQDGKLVHIPGKSTDTYGTRGRILGETITTIRVRLGRPSATYPTNVTYDVYALIFVDTKGDQ